MQTTRFRPATHGFHFSNNDIHWSFGFMQGRNLCGGMSFASLDYFFHRMSIPSTRSVPEEGTPLHNYILRRQMDAHRYAIPRLITGSRRWRNEPFESCLRADQHFGVVKQLIDGGSPVPILLSAAGASLSTNSHWVVATGYEMIPTSVYGCAICTKLYVYDNNQPDVDSELLPDMVGRCFRLSQSRRRYGYYAPFEGYTAVRPTREAMNAIPSTTTLATNPFGLPRPGL